MMMFRYQAKNKTTYGDIFRFVRNQDDLGPTNCSTVLLKLGGDVIQSVTVTSEQLKFRNGKFRDY